MAPATLFSLYHRGTTTFPQEAVARSSGPLASKAIAVPSFARLFARSSDLLADSPGSGADNMVDILLVVFGLVFLALIVASLVFLFLRSRRLRRQRELQLPTYNDVKQSPGRPSLAIETSVNGRSSVFYIGRDGQPMLQNPRSPPDSPDNVPDIHITFPDEYDDQGRPQSGRVLVVRVGDNASVGLAPVQDHEQLPAYEKESSSQFHSIGMDQIGGLKEKDRTLVP